VSSGWGRITKFIFAVVVVVLCGVVGVGIGVANWLRKDLPSPANLQTIAPPVKTLVYDRNEKLVHEFFKENRSIVPLREIPRPLVQAILAIEDRRFYSHWGIDPIRLARALITDIITHSPQQGGSTITQQLARNLFLTHEKTMTRKLKEIVLAIRIEQTYTKDEILEMYFNQIYFGEGAYGVDAAAKVYFGKRVQELTLPECALLAGLPRNPRDYSPRRDPDRAIRRRNLVLSQMLAAKFINRVQGLMQVADKMDDPLQRLQSVVLRSVFIRQNLLEHFNPVHHAVVVVCYSVFLLILWTVAVALLRKASRIFRNVNKMPCVGFRPVLSHLVGPTRNRSQAVIAQQELHVFASHGRQAG